MTAANTVMGAMGQSASPRLARHHARGEAAAFRSLELKLLGIAAALGIAGVLVAATVGGELLTIVYTREYGAYADVFVLVMVSVGLWNIASAFGYVATARRRLKLQVVVLFVIVAVSIAAGFLLVPSLGVRGAAISMVVSSAVAVVGYALLSI